MKRIKQIADGLGVTNQAVYKRVVGSLKNDVAPYVQTFDGCIMLSEQGEEIVIKAFAKRGAHTETHTEAHTVYSGVHTSLQYIIHKQEQQIEELKHDVARLQERNDILFAELLAAMKKKEPWYKRLPFGRREEEHGQGDA